MDVLATTSPYHILFLSVFLYLIAYGRRNDMSDRPVRLAPLPEKILFPFSDLGEAAPISIIIAAYIELTLPASYIAIGIFKLPLHQVNTIWDTGCFCMLCLGTGFSLLYALPESKEWIVLKLIGYVIAAGLIIFGGVLLTSEIIGIL